MTSLVVAWPLFVLSAAASLSASAVLVSRLERVAARLGLREAALGLVAALAADGPEITAAITGVLRGQRTIGVGVVMGSNAFNLAALLGLGALSAGRIRLHRDVVVFEGLVAVAIASIALGAGSGALGPAVALALCAPFLIPYAAVSTISPASLGRWRLPLGFGPRLAQAVRDEEAELAAAVHPGSGGRGDVTVAIVAVGVVVGASVILEHVVTTLGSHYDLPQIVTGGVILAAVTSLPNAVSAIYLGRRGRGSAVLSLSLNSNALNVVFGLLIPAVFVGIVRYGGSGILVTTWYGAMTVIALLLAYSGRGLGRRSGVVIICCYLALVGVLAAR